MASKIPKYVYPRLLNSNASQEGRAIQRVIGKVGGSKNDKSRSEYAKLSGHLRYAFTNQDVPIDKVRKAIVEALPYLVTSLNQKSLEETNSRPLHKWFPRIFQTLGKLDQLKSIQILLHLVDDVLQSVLPANGSNEAFLLVCQSSAISALPAESAHQLYEQIVAGESTAGIDSGSEMINVSLYTAVVQASLRDRKWQLGLRFFTKAMEAEKMSAHMVSAGLLLYQEIQDYKACFNLLEKAERLQAVDIVVYNTLLNIWIRGGTLFLSEFLSPSSQTKSSSSAATSEDDLLIQEILRRMQSNNVEPSIVTLNILLKSCVRNRDWRKAMTYLEDGVFGDVVWDQTTFNTLLQCFPADDWKVLCNMLTRSADNPTLVMEIDLRLRDVKLDSVGLTTVIGMLKARVTSLLGHNPTLLSTQQLSEQLSNFEQSSNFEELSNYELPVYEILQEILNPRVESELREIHEFAERFLLPICTRLVRKGKGVTKEQCSIVDATPVHKIFVDDMLLSKLVSFFGSNGREDVALKLYGKFGNIRKTYNRRSHQCLDLHGLTVGEARTAILYEIMKPSAKDSSALQCRSLLLDLGRGNHSKSQVGHVLRRYVEEFAQKHESIMSLEPFEDDRCLGLLTVKKSFIELDRRGAKS